ncbi:hypothetical protein VNO78_34955 [Psophocarpus tetragonolobus]|uniref:Uncharacterized protein n=1 Tax=Psophocarpus tetragonolobus TaxID=3891 RepID=A0AAN9NUK7_PSOTE
MVTTSPLQVSKWVTNIPTESNLIVGLDVKWRPNMEPYSHMRNPIATLQLCVGNRCLIFQILHAPFLPRALFTFLACPTATFVGVHVQEHANMLFQDYSLNVRNVTDLATIAATRLCNPHIHWFGLHALSLCILGFNIIYKPYPITWDHLFLFDDQVASAAIDAFLSCWIGRTLISITN